LKEYALFFGLPMTITNVDTLKHLEKAKFGGLSNVLHRKNIAGETHINHFKYEGGKVYSYDEPEIMTHFTGFDCNSLYPSVGASVKSDQFDYTGGVMHMPGRFMGRVLEPEKMRTVVEKRSIFVFFVSVKGHFPPERYNDLINFPPIIRPFFIEEDYDDLLEKGSLEESHKDRPRKLTQLLSTMGEFTCFYCYTLWFLIDLGFIIDEFKEMDLFLPMQAVNFNEFITTFMDERIKAKEAGKKGLSECFKMILNSSYGKDGMNTAKYTTVQISNRNKTLLKQTTPNFVNTRMINHDLFLVQMSKMSYTIETPLQCACATLDNAKFLYLLFIYNFVYRCIDTRKIHFIEGDTDSMYFAIAGDPNDNIHQQFKHVIKDMDFYQKNVFKWLPDPTKGMKDEKKLLGLCVENEGFEMIALGPKCYTYKTDKRNVMKVKGVSLKQNPHITPESYKQVLESKIPAMGENILLKMKSEKGKDFQMTKQIQPKIVMTAIHNKMRVLSNESCAPFIEGLGKDDYIVIDEKLLN
jgi:hypothetical protein